MTTFRLYNFWRTRKINPTDLIPSLALLISSACPPASSPGALTAGRNDEWKKDHECFCHSLFIRFRLIKTKVSKLMRTPVGGSRFYSGFFFFFCTFYLQFIYINIVFSNQFQYMHMEFGNNRQLI